MNPLITLLVAAMVALLAAPAATSPAAISPGHYRDFGDAGGFLDILPPGQQGTFQHVVQIGA